MSILSGFSKFKKYLKTSSGYKLSSLWTSSETVEMGNGNTLEENLGEIKGITSSLATDNANYSLSASAGKDLQDQITVLNSDLGSLIKIISTIHTSGATINANNSVAYSPPTLDGYTLINVNSSCNGAHNTNVIGFWDKESNVIIFRNLTDNQIITGQLSTVGIFIKN